MALQEHSFRIEGVSSLLMHSPKGMGLNTSKSVGVKHVPTPEEEAELGCYRDEKEGHLYLPSNMFRASLLSGAGGRRFGTTSARTVLAGSVFNLDTKTPLVHPRTGETITDYAVHVTRVVVQRNGILRARPEIEPWGCVVRFEIDLDFVQPFQVEELLNVAGRIAGVGDWRPQTKGPHGRYRAELVSASEEAA